MRKIRKIQINKTKTSLLFSVFIGTCLLTISAVASSTIEGVWKHPTKPALIEFNLTTGVASVKEHQTHKQNSGLTIIKNIVQSTETEWVGEMYNGYKDKYVFVTIKLNDTSLSVFDSENSEVLKLIKE
ncbi:hypothetical protein ACOI22_13700 [Glaciecola sp. 2405UD65-10]|uniref:hypothetical protein n=1 Tax=Glaciecola sp. 2405UD65-10 TaxID=3397244 RepID=UPI003B5C6405